MCVDNGKPNIRQCNLSYFNGCSLTKFPAYEWYAQTSFLAGQFKKKYVLNHRLDLSL